MSNPSQQNERLSIGEHSSLRVDANEIGGVCAQAMNKSTGKEKRELKRQD